MNDLMPFTFSDQPVRVVLDGAGEPWFVAGDIARVLGYRDAFNVVRRLDEEDRGTRLMSTPSGAQDVTVINEAGLYAAVLGSQVERARAFKRWVTHEVLPSIRKTGSYTNAAVPSVPDLSTPAGVLAMAEQLTATARALVAASEKVAELEPDAAFAKALMSADGDYSLREAAQVLKRDHHIDIGQNRLMKHLVEIGWVDRNGRPYQAQVELQRLAMRVRSYDHPHTGEAMATVQVRVTPKGVRWLHEHWPQPPLQLSVIAGGAS